MLEYDFHIDELDLEVSEGQHVTITGDFMVFAGVDYQGDVEVFQVAALCGRNSRPDSPDWQRIDDNPAFAAITEAASREAPKYAPEYPSRRSRIAEQRESYLEHEMEMRRDHA